MNRLRGDRARRRRTTDELGTIRARASRCRTSGGAALVLVGVRRSGIVDFDADRGRHALAVARSDRRRPAGPRARRARPGSPDRHRLDDERTSSPCPSASMEELLDLRVRRSAGGRRVSLGIGGPPPASLRTSRTRPRTPPTGSSSRTTSIARRSSRPRRALTTEDRARPRALQGRAEEQADAIVDALARRLSAAADATVALDLNMPRRPGPESGERRGRRPSRSSRQGSAGRQRGASASAARRSWFRR